MFRRTTALSYRLFLAGIVLFAVGATAPAFAAEDDSDKREEITLSPATKQHKITASATKQDSFKVINTGETTYSFTVYARPYFVEGEDYQPVYTTDEKRSDAYSWVQFDKTAWTIKPGETAQVNYTIRVPANASPGGHYGVLFAETDPSDADEGTQSVLRTKRVGSVLSVTVPGDIKRAGEVLETNIGRLQFEPPLETTTRIQNTGNIDFDATQTLTVKDVFGRVKYKDSAVRTIFPDTTRKVDFDWQSAAWFGLYRVDLKTAFLDKDTTTSRLVMVVPLWLLLVGPLVIAGSSYALVQRRR